MIAKLLRLTAVCLMAAPALPAASLHLPAASPVRSVFIPDSNHGLDWNIFIPPGTSPFAFLQMPDLAASLAGVSQSFVQAASVPSLEEMEQRAFGWIILIVAVLLAAMQLIPTYHSYRSRLRALNFPVPVH